MVEGIGIDIIEVCRIKNLAEKNPRFLKKIFTDSEISYCSEKRNKYRNIKESFRKDQ